MILVMSLMMTPALAQIFLTFFAPPGAVGPPPPFVAVAPSLVADLFIVPAMIHDWRTRGKPHQVYVIGGAILLAQQVLVVPIAATATWIGMVKAFESLAG